MLGFGPLASAPLAAMPGCTVLSVYPPRGVQAGATAITVKGFNFGASATLKVGANSATSVIVVDSSTITAVTPASTTPWIDDITVTNATQDVGLLYRAFDRVSPSSGVKIKAQSAPSTLSLYQINYAGVLPFVGTGTGGSSGSRQYDSVGIDPTVGASYNGHNAVDFAFGSGARLMGPVNTAIFSTGSLSFFAVFRARSSSKSVSAYLDGNLCTDLANAETTFGFTDAGISGCILDTVGYQRVQADAEVGEWIFAQFSANGTLLKCRANNRNPFSQVPCTAFTSSVASNCYIGISYGGVLLDAEVLVWGGAPFAIADATYDGMGVYFENLFGLDLGFSHLNITPIDPATLAMTGLHIDFPGGTSWPGTASTGSSGSNAKTTVTGTAPSASTLNGHATAVLDGTKNMQAGSATNVMLGTETEPLGYATTWLANFASLAPDASPGLGYANPALFTDPQAVVGVVVSSDSGLQAYQIDENDGYANYVVTPPQDGGLGTAAWVGVQTRWDGATKLQARLLSASGGMGRWFTVICRRPSYPTGGGQPFFGSNYNQANFVNGTIAAEAISNRAFSTYTLDGIAAWMQDRYSTNLGVPNVGPGAGAFKSLANSGAGTVSGNVTSTGSAAFKSLANAGTGTETFSSSGAAAFKSFAATGVGVLTYSATGTAAFKSFANAGTGTETFAGTGSAAFSPLANSGAATILFSSSGAGALSSLGASGTGTETFQATGSGAFKSLAAAGTGTQTNSSTGSAAFSPLACSGAAAETFAATGSAAFKSFANAGTGTQTNSSTGSAAFSPLANAGNGTLTFTATGSAAFQALAASGSANELFSSTGAAAFSPFGANGVGVYGTLISGVGSAGFSSFGASGAGAETFTGSGAGAISSLACSGAAAESYASTGSAKFSSFAAAGAAAEVYTGVGAAALSSLAGTGVASETFTSTGAGAFKSLAGSGTAALSVTSTGSAAFSPLASAGAAQEVFAAIGAAAFASFDGLGFVNETFTGSGAAAMHIDGSGVGFTGNAALCSGSAAFSSLGGVGYGPPYKPGPAPSVGVIIASRDAATGQLIVSARVGSSATDKSTSEPGKQTSGAAVGGSTTLGGASSTGVTKKGSTS